MGSETKNNISRAFSKAAKWQFIITLLVAGCSLALGGHQAAFSALAGGSIVIVGAYAAMIMMRRSNGETPSSVLISLLKAEAIKVMVIVMLLFMTFKYFQGLVPLSLIGGLASSALASGAGLRATYNKTNN
jgi:ATP synthase protein I